MSPSYALHIFSASHILHALEPWMSCTTLVRKWHRWPENPLVKVPTYKADLFSFGCLLFSLNTQKIYSGKHEGNHGLRPTFLQPLLGCLEVGVSLDLGPCYINLVQHVGVIYSSPP